MKILSTQLDVLKPFDLKQVSFSITDDFKIDWLVTLTNQPKSSIYNLGVFLMIELIKKDSQELLLDCEIANKYCIESESMPTFEELQRLVLYSAEIIPAKYNSIKRSFLPPLLPFGFLSPQEFDELLLNSINQLSERSKT